MSELVTDFYNMLAIRNQLLTQDRNDLNELYQDEDAYVTFLNAIATLLNNDSGLILIDEEIIQKIFSIIQIHRFDLKIPQLNDFINEIITHLNGVKAYPDKLKDEIEKAYFIYNETVREKVFLSRDDLKDSLKMDAAVFVALSCDKLDILRDDDYTLASLNYMMKCCPEFFTEEEINQRAQQLIDDIDSRSKKLSIRKMKVKGSRKNYHLMNEYNML